MTKHEIQILLNSKSDTENKVICIEELSELQKEITKLMRGFKSTENLIEEMADVTIVLEMMKLIFDVSEEVIDKEIRRKMKRNLIRAGMQNKNEAC